MSDIIDFNKLGDRFRGVPLLGGLLGGILSFITGYLAFLGLAAGTGDGIDLEAQSLRQVGQFFYNSLLVPTHEQTTQVFENEAQGETVVQETIRDIWYNPFFESGTVDVETSTYLDGNLYNEQSQTLTAENPGSLTLPELTFPDIVYLAIPVVVLLGIGFLLAYRFVSLEGAQSWDDILTRSLITGGTMTLGFALLVLAGLFLFVIDGVALFSGLSGEDVFTRPERVPALMFGLAYPAVCSSVGAFLGLVAQRPSFDRDEHDRTPDEATETESAIDGGGSHDDSITQDRTHSEESDSEESDREAEPAAQSASTTDSAPSTDRH
ncbi:hypothetical protein ACFQJ7_16225 [Halovenus rubra]|uniref:Uncharacterized protein n=2 Tax=Halovenus rubra TaxID=869890 RepID=A0ACC7E3W6_9EURY|nr:hypothetical protein [Halovenus rubra]